MSPGCSRPRSSRARNCWPWSGIVAGAIIITAGDRAVYLYGATNDRALPLRAGYFLHWYVIRWLRDNTRANWYDLGGTDGLATIGDLIEEIVGEIQDEHEIEPLAFEEVDAGEVRIAGQVPVWEVNERFGLSLPEDLYETIGGFIFGHLGRVAKPGDEIHVDGGLFRVVAMDGRRIARVCFIATAPRAQGEEQY
jgi:hypothetical protein